VTPSPRVSITIPTYNCARFLGQAIRSALSQTYTDYEIVVVDDGSTDDTREVLAEFGDRIRYVYQPNGGLSSARNLAVSQARGELIAYLDADDLWYPHRLEAGVAFLDAHEECGLVHSDWTMIDETDRVIQPRVNADSGRPFPRGHCTLDLLQRSHIQVPTVLERRECFDRVGTFDPRLKTAQDYLHWIRIAMDGMAIGYVPESLALYRRTASSLSSSPRRVLDDGVIIFETLLTEQTGLRQFGPEAVDLARDRLYHHRRELAYLDRLEGRTTESLGHTLSLVRQWPLRAELYVDLVKACAGSVRAPRR
jgi:glycosyltransferase involved in cell wall biosynthesis